MRATIGVFDSGFGGLTVLKALLERIPQARYLYFGDTARLPYGSKSTETVARYACEAAQFLEHEGADLLVVACNTATALALEQIRDAVSRNVVGVIEPGAQQALATSRTGKLVVVGTDATISSHAYQRALCALQLSAREKACPLLVPLVEEGWIDHPVTQQVAHIYLEEAFAGDFRTADVLLLGCTHYPLLKPLLRRVVPAHVSMVDSAESTALSVLNFLKSGTFEVGPEQLNNVQLPRNEVLPIADTRFFVTDSVDKFKKLGTMFLGQEIRDIRHVDLKE